LDQEAGLRTDEAREWRRWQAIVGEVLDDVPDRDGCFAALHAHFARPEAWRVESDAALVLEELTRRGLTIGIASNFDRRLRSVVVGLPELRAARQLVISSEVGWRKPAREFFDAACRQIGHAPEQTVFVGDDLENDFAGARHAGLTALLFDPLSRIEAPTRLEKLTQLLLR
jgi:putative hydrolase of the HAD superfamily